MPKTKIKVAFNSVGTEPAEIRIYDTIGKNPWDESGFDANDLSDALASIPRNREVKFRVNSAGGDVWEGMTIRTLVNEWPAKKTLMIDGVAASTASWCFLSCNEVIMARHGQMFIHDAWTFAGGNAADMRAAADSLDKTSNQIADMYARKSGKSQKEMRDKMLEGTLLTGEECKDLGLVDKLTEEEAISNFCPEAIASMRNKLQVQRNAVNKNALQGKQDTIMNREKMIALLNKWGVTFDNKITDEDLIKLVEAGKPAAAPAIENKITSTTNDAVVLDIRNQLEEIKKQNAALTESNNAARKQRITNEIHALRDNDQLTEVEVEKAIIRCVADETYLNELKARPSVAPGTLAVTFDLRADASPKEVVRGFDNFSKPVQAWQKGANVPMKDLGAASMNRGLFFQKNRLAILEMMNANTIPAGLQRNVIMQERIRDFARRLIMLSAVSTVYSNVPLEGTDKMEIPYYDLDSQPASSFVTGTGYTTIKDTTTAVKEVQIGEAVQAAGVFRDRKFLGLGFSSQEMARQPWLKISELVGLRIEQLANLIMTQLLGIITVANYPGTLWAAPRAVTAIDATDLADAKLACKLWPQSGRTLFLGSEYDATLLKDVRFTNAFAAASDLAIKEGRLNPRVFGFDYNENPTIPANGENLGGFAVFKSAILVGFAPVPPVEEVRNAGTQYEIITEPTSGISLEFRSFGDNVTDSAKYIVESSFGAGVGNPTALKRAVYP